MHYIAVSHENFQLIANRTYDVSHVLYGSSESVLS